MDLEKKVNKPAEKFFFPLPKWHTRSALAQDWKRKSAPTIWFEHKLCSQVECACADNIFLTNLRPCLFEIKTQFTYDVSWGLNWPKLVFILYSHLLTCLRLGHISFLSIQCFFPEWIYAIVLFNNYQQMILRSHKNPVQGFHTFLWNNFKSWNFYTLVTRLAIVFSLYVIYNNITFNRTGIFPHLFWFDPWNFFGYVRHRLSWIPLIFE